MPLSERDIVPLSNRVKVCQDSSHAGFYEELLIPTYYRYLDTHEGNNGRLSPILFDLEQHGTEGWTWVSSASLSSGCAYSATSPPPP